jgi:hypothetical protein
MGSQGDSAMLYLLAADALLALHTLIVAFILFGLVLIVAGGLLGWSWTRNRGFRYAHLAAIAIVVLQAWLGRICPLTAWEMALRAKAGDTTYAGAFIAHWLGQVLYYDLPAWVFVAAYSAFGALVLLAWFRWPPRRRDPDETQ